MSARAAAGRSDGYFFCPNAALSGYARKVPVDSVAGTLAERTTLEVKDRVTASWVSAHPALAAAEINRLRALLALEVA